MATEDDVRRIALSLPETIEKPWFGTPGFRVKDKGFLRIRSESEGGLVVWVSDLGEKEALLASEPDKFFTTPHYDGHPTVLVNLPAIDVDELRELITESWLIRALKRVRQSYEDQSSATPSGREGPLNASDRLGRQVDPAQQLGVEGNHDGRRAHEDGADGGRKGQAGPRQHTGRQRDG
jgi:hypothetical protein